MSTGGEGPRRAGPGGRPAVRPVRTVGLVGCGRMGSAIGRHLLRGRWPLVATDVDPRAAEGLVPEGARAAPTAADVGEVADLVLVVVVDDAQVEEAVDGPEGALRRARPGTVVAISSSVRPSTCRRLAERGAGVGAWVIDVALARGERGAEAGALLLYCGGPEAVVDACRPVFSSFAADVLRLGDVGAGQAGKVANNILLWACIRADVEAQRLCRALGVEPSTLRPALGLGSGANRPLAEWGMHRLRWPAKDLELAVALAEEHGVDVPLVRALAPLMDELTVRDLEDLR